MLGTVNMGKVTTEVRAIWCIDHKTERGAAGIRLLQYGRRENTRFMTKIMQEQLLPGWQKFGTQEEKQRVAKAIKERYPEEETLIV